MENQEYYFFLKNVDQTDLGTMTANPFKFKGKVVFVFSCKELGEHFMSRFIHEYLIPKIGEDSVKKIKVTITGPSRPANEMLLEGLGLAQKQEGLEKWYILEESLVKEASDFFNGVYWRDNQEVRFEDQRQ